MNPISIFLFWLMITKLEMGTGGGALALTLCDIMRAFFNWIATRYCAHPDTLPQYCNAQVLRQEVLCNLAGQIELMKLSMPGALTVWSEWWAWECCVVMAGWLCSQPAAVAAALEEAAIATEEGLAAPLDECAPLAAQPILGNTMVLGFMCTFGINTAACTHVGNLLGAGEPQRAKASAHAAAMMVFCLAAGASTNLLIFRREWAYAFSPDDQLAQDLIVVCMPLVCVYITLDALGIGLLNSILRAAGRVKIPGLINLVSFCKFTRSNLPLLGCLDLFLMDCLCYTDVVGLPISAWLAFGDSSEELDLGLPALWIGLDCGMIVMNIGLALYFCRLDWEFEADKAQELALATASPGNSPMARDAKDNDEDEDEDENVYGEKAGLLSDGKPK